MGKMCVEISASSSVFRDALKHVQEHTSAADDRDTEERKTKQFAAWVVNHSQMELEATQAAGLVLGIGSANGSEKTEAHFGWDFERLARIAAETRDQPLADTTFGQGGDEEDDTDDESEIQPNTEDHTAASELAQHPANDEGANFSTFDEYAMACAVGDMHLGAGGGGDAAACADGGDGAGGGDGADVAGPNEDLAQLFGASNGDRFGQSRSYLDKKGDKIPVSDAHTYAYRDQRLLNFTAHEFNRLFCLRRLNPDAKSGIAKADNEWYWKELARVEEQRQNEVHGNQSTALPSMQGKPCYRYLLREPHPLSDSWIIVRRQKWGVNMLCGKPPPSEPEPVEPGVEPSSATLSKRRAFARYMVANFVPWDKDQSPLLTYENWLKYVAGLEEAACYPQHERERELRLTDGAQAEVMRRSRLVAHARLFDIENAVNGFKVKQVQRILPLKHRYRARTLWNGCHPKPACCGEGGVDAKSRATAREIAKLQAKADRMRPTKDLGKRQKEVQRFVEWTDSLTRALPSQMASRAAGGSRLSKLWASAAQPTRRTIDGVRRDVSAALKAISAPLPASNSPGQADVNLPPFDDGSSTWWYRRDDTQSTSGPFAVINEASYEAASAAHKARCNAGLQVGAAPLNVQQRDGGRAFLEYAQLRKRGRSSGATAAQIRAAAEAAGVEQITLVVGAGGTGKSQMVHAVDAEMDARTLGELVVTAYTGVASAPFGGPTLLSLLSLPIASKGSTNVMDFQNEGKRHEALEKFYQECGVRVEDLGGLVIDEVSFDETSVFGQVDHRLRALLGEPNVMCGGLPILLCGDNFQKGPPQGTPWYQVLVKDAAGEKIERLNDGTRCAIGRGIALLKAARCVELKRLMRVDANDPEAEAFQTVQLQMRNTRAERPVPEELTRRLQPVSRADLDGDDEWLFAPIGVLSSIEQDAINLAQLKAFAQYFDLPLFKWRLPMVDAPDDAEVLERLYQNETGGVWGLWGYFVEGAPVLLDENIKPVRGLVNGSAALLDSLEFDGPVPDKVANAFARGVFDVVELDAPPLAVNVRIGGERSPPGSAPGSAPGSVLWHGVELDDLSSGIPEYVEGDAQVVPLRVSPQPTEAKLRSAWAAVNGLPEKPRVRRHRYILAFALTDFKVRSAGSSSSVMHHLTEEGLDSRLQHSSRAVRCQSSS